MFIKTIRTMKRKVAERKKIFIIQLPNKRILSNIFTQIYKKNYKWIKKVKRQSSWSDTSQEKIPKWPVSI